MPQTLAVESHPQKDQIIQALIKGESPYKIEKWAKPFVSKASIYAYKNKRLQPALMLAAQVSKKTPLIDGSLSNRPNVKHAFQQSVDGILETADDPKVQEYLAKIRKHDARIDRAIEETSEGETRDPRSLAILHKQHLSGLELQAKLAGIGHINGPAATQNTNSITVFMPGHGEPTAAADELETIEAEVVDVTGQD